MTTERIAGALHGVLAGEMDGMALIESSSPEELTTAAGSLVLVLSRDAVIKVLRRYQSGLVGVTDVQRWASFIRRGYVARAGGKPVRPLDIRWDLGHEDAISEAIGRLDELGDIIDGNLREGEVWDLIDALALGE